MNGVLSFRRDPVQYFSSLKAESTCDGHDGQIYRSIKFKCDVVLNCVVFPLEKKKKPRQILNVDDREHVVR